MRVVAMNQDGSERQIECVAITVGKVDGTPTLALFDTKENYLDNNYFELVVMDSVCVIDNGYFDLVVKD